VDSDDGAYSKDFPACRVRKSGNPSVHCVDAKTDTHRASDTHITRPDYCRVVCVLCIVLCIAGTMFMYGRQFQDVSDPTDTTLSNANQYQGDVLVVSLHLQVQGATKHDIPKKAEIIIPMNTLTYKIDTPLDKVSRG
jgi:hypothetical protein